MHSFNLRPEEGDEPKATAVVQLMDQGDLLIGVRPYGAHPDSEYAIVLIAVEDDGTLVVRLHDGGGGLIGVPHAVDTDGNVVLKGRA